MYLRSARSHSRIFLHRLPNPPPRRLNSNTTLYKTKLQIRKMPSNQGEYSCKSSGTNSEGNHYCARDYGSGAANPNTYHYSNSDGSYYYSNANGSTYHSSPSGNGTYTAPRGGSSGKK